MKQERLLSDIAEISEYLDDIVAAVINAHEFFADQIDRTNAEYGRHARGHNRAFSDFFQSLVIMELRRITSGSNERNLKVVSNGNLYRLRIGENFFLLFKVTGPDGGRPAKPNTKNAKKRTSDTLDFYGGLFAGTSYGLSISGQPQRELTILIKCRYGYDNRPELQGLELMLQDVHGRVLMSIPLPTSFDNDKLRRAKEVSTSDEPPKGAPFKAPTIANPDTRA